MSTPEEVVPAGKPIDTEKPAPDGHRKPRAAGGRPSTGNRPSPGGQAPPGVLELPARKRGRPVGASTKRKPPKAEATSPVELAAVIFGLHVTLATVVPELLLEEREAKSLAGALVTVEKQFPGMVLDPRVMAILGLVGTAAIIYVPRGRAVLRRIKKEKSVPSPDQAGQ